MTFNHLIDVPSPQKSTDSLVEFRQEWQAEPMTKDEVEDEVLEAVEESKEGGNRVRDVPPKSLIMILRKNDVPGENRTCAASARRLPLSKFRTPKSEVCIENE